MALLLLVGCYAPRDQTCVVTCAESSDCPGSLVCSTTKVCGASKADCAAMPGDVGAGDGILPDLGIPFTACSPAATHSSRAPLGLNGDSFSGTSSGMALFQNGGAIQQTDLEGANPAPVLFTGGVDKLSNPMLAPNAIEAFFIGNIASTFKLERSVFDPNNQTWPAPDAIGTSGLTLDASTRIGQPTATNPRRMAAAFSSMMKEAVEQNGTWVFMNVIDFSGITPLSSPTLSSDGLTLMFIGQDNTATPKVYTTRRLDVTKPFDSPTVYFDDPINVESHVTISPDCQTVYLSAGNQVFAFK